MRIFGLILAFLIMIPSLARADEDSLKLPPPGTTVLNLSATETQKVPQDLLISSLRIENESATPKAVQDTINTAMQAALALAKAETAVKTSTGTYSVYPYDPTPPITDPAHPPQKQPKTWRGQQTIELQSLNSEALLKLVGALQEKGFAMDNLTYTLSPEKFESVQDDLLTKALGKLTAKADLAAKTLKKSGYDMLNVDLSPGGQVMPMYARAAMMDAGAMEKSMAAPVARAGESDVSLTVSARVLLKP
jgi:predicted secreted protein